MLTTDDLKQLIEKLEKIDSNLRYTKFDKELKWLKEILKEAENSPYTATQFCISKSLSVTDMLNESDN